MRGWAQSTIGKSCTIVNGGTPKTSTPEYWGGEHLWITPAEMGKRASPLADDTARKLTDSGLQDCSAQLLPPWSVILSSRAPIGHLVINTEPMATNQGCKGLVPGALLDHKFLFYYLGSIVGLLNDLGTGATFKELSSAKLKDVPLPLPPLAEQRRIVAILDEAFAGLETMRSHAAKNVQNAREVFDSYLNDLFSPDGRGRAVTTLDQLSSVITDGDHAPPPKSSEGVPFITISNIDKASRSIDFSDTFHVPRSYFDQLKPAKKPRRGDVLYTVTGSFGIPVLVQSDKDFCFQRHIGLIRPTASVNSTWLYYLLCSRAVFAQADARATGTAQKTVSLQVLRSLVVPIVPLARQAEMVAALDRLAIETSALESVYRRKLAAIDELKQSIVQQAFSGELTRLFEIAA